MKHSVNKCTIEQKFMSKITRIDIHKLFKGGHELTEMTSGGKTTHFIGERSITKSQFDECKESFKDKSTSRGEESKYKYTKRIYAYKK